MENMLQFFGAKITNNLDDNPTIEFSEDNDDIIAQSLTEIYSIRSYDDSKYSSGSYDDCQTHSGIIYTQQGKLRILKISFKKLHI